MVHLINFADERFKTVQHISSKRAIEIGGVDKVWEFSPEDISEDFKQENSNIFSNKRGYGLWLWKPYFINKLLNTLTDGDVLIYSDAGVSFIRNVQPLIDVLDKTRDGVLFFGLPLLDVEWTKGETFSEANYTPSESDIQVDGSFFIIKVCDKARLIITEWLEISKNEVALSPKRFNPNIKNYPKFQSHREDQSTLSIVLHKNNIELYRDPSDYGEFPFQYKNSVWTFVPLKFTNSHYPTMTVHHRGVSVENYLKSYRIKHYLSKIGLWNQFMSGLKSRIKADYN